MNLRFGEEVPERVDHHSPADPHERKAEFKRAIEIAKRADNAIHELTLYRESISSQLYGEKRNVSQFLEKIGAIDESISTYNRIKQKATLIVSHYQKNHEQEVVIWMRRDKRENGID